MLGPPRYPNVANDSIFESKSSDLADFGIREVSAKAHLISGSAFADIPKMEGSEKVVAF